MTTIADRIRPFLSPLLAQALDARTEEGVRKYGQTLDDNQKADRAKAVHLLQELLDACGYAEWLEEDSMLTPLLTKLANELAADFPDLTLAELLFKEGHSGASGTYPTGQVEQMLWDAIHRPIGVVPDSCLGVYAALLEKGSRPITPPQAEKFTLSRPEIEALARAALTVSRSLKEEDEPRRASLIAGLAIAIDQLIGETNSAAARSLAERTRANVANEAHAVTLGRLNKISALLSEAQSALEPYMAVVGETKVLNQAAQVCAKISLFRASDLGGRYE